MPILTPEKALRTLRKNPLILDAILRDVTQKRAASATDGPDGWSVLEVMCHLLDFEEIFFTRARRILNETKPHFQAVDQLELVRLHDYKHQDLRDRFERYVELRRQLIALIEHSTDAQWSRRGVYADSTVVTLLELAINIGLHDVNHIEQIVRALGVSSIRMTQP
jgi:hypothetical protein